jgi:hypothetical protein
MFLANKLNKGAGAPTPKDAQFNYVTMLLHGDGTNGAQNNTFLDSSTNNFTITRNGNTTQGSFSPYGSNWSNYLSTTATRFDSATSTAFALSTSDFCYEAWIFASNPGANDYPRAFGLGPYYNDVKSFGVIIADTDYSEYITVYFNDGSLGRKLISSTTLPANQWNHIAVCRSGSNYALFLNGTRIATYSSSSAISDGNATYAYIGSTNNGSEGFVGYASNVRLVKGSSVYDPTASTLTVPTTPLTAISGTSLLACKSNRFIDNSSNSFSLTATGTPNVQRFTPFGVSTAYSAATIGGSGYFDGSGDLLNLPDSPAWAYGSGDFTIDLWYYPVSNTTTDIQLIGQWTSGSTDESWSIGHHWTFGLVFFWTTDGSTDQSIGSTSNALFTLNAWNHVAVSKSGTTVSLYLNGVRTNTGTLTGSVSDSSRVLDVGGRSQSGANQIQGYLSDVRTVKGTAVYDPTQTTLTVPTAPLTAITNTALLLNFTNGAIFDNAMMNDLETLGNSQISTSVKKYGTGSMAFDGTGDWMLSVASQSIGFRTGDFTVEFWIYPSNWTNTYVGVMAGILTNSLWIGKNDTNFVLRAANNTDLVSYGTMPTTGTWTHIAITRSGTTARMFYNGTQVASATTGNDFVDAAFYIGQDGGSNAFTGYIDDLRITKGYARYTANFTAPTAALPDIGPN